MTELRVGDGVFSGEEFEVSVRDRHVDVTAVADIVGRGRLVPRGVLGSIHVLTVVVVGIVATVTELGEGNIGAVFRIGSAEDDIVNRGHTNVTVELASGLVATVSDHGVGALGVGGPAVVALALGSGKVDPTLGIERDIALDVGEVVESSVTDLDEGLVTTAHERSVGFIGCVEDDISRPRGLDRDVTLEGAEGGGTGADHPDRPDAIARPDRHREPVRIRGEGNPGMDTAVVAGNGVSTGIDNSRIVVWPDDGVVGAADVLHIPVAGLPSSVTDHGEVAPVEVRVAAASGEEGDVIRRFHRDIGIHATRSVRAVATVVTEGLVAPVADHGEGADALARPEGDCAAGRRHVDLTAVTIAIGRIRVRDDLATAVTDHGVVPVTVGVSAGKLDVACRIDIDVSAAGAGTVAEVVSARVAIARGRPGSGRGADG